MLSTPPTASATAYFGRLMLSLVLLSMVSDPKQAVGAATKVLAYAGFCPEIMTEGGDTNPSTINTITSHLVEAVNKREEASFVAVEIMRRAEGELCCFGQEIALSFFVKFCATLSR